MVAVIELVMALFVVYMIGVLASSFIEVYSESNEWDE
jgi:hypothetical protein